ncbi:ABC transporter permease subunit [Enterococcus hulanensis]|uniref:ABC transporter permease subunit n=1 Tax=Enterococcus hulanensis TaxID=2559929 RepID=A0ABU3F3K7_9ENTE|nr:ABC transporter permease subunit [Enterococcus hulanensis]MDT2601721.1 ABC transporter permease subunit [Enterococcus hulanensis]MDT2611106.1 ABC transporter permease subunit [Enterococcus hulanensis]MDT2618608.1 ABC transporter permease subunit [Enterococcus hulanensis]MDT2629753.1 ABC transporter permease subunit [Enterococcus hulanensis]MDT2657485.1 ABC transporter permease subunit [Enterococcus hulanensis]
MFNNRQKAIMVKDIRGITENKRYFSVLTILPLLFSVVFPTLMLLTVLMSPTDSSSFTEMARILPDFQKLDQEQLIRELLSLMVNNVIPIFFLIIPIMTASVMAASSFVGEKEKRTLETLLYSPLSIREIFRAKVYASFLVGVLVTYVSFVLTVIVVEVELYIFKGMLLPLSLNWLWVMLLIVPAITIISIVLIVKGSAKATSIEESQQKAAFLILPLALLMIGQFTGILVFSGWIVVSIGLVLLVIALLLLRYSMTGFTYERLLDR